MDYAGTKPRLGLGPQFLEIATRSPSHGTEVRHHDHVEPALDSVVWSVSDRLPVPFGPVAPFLRDQSQGQLPVPRVFLQAAGAFVPYRHPLPRLGPPMTRALRVLREGLQPGQCRGGVPVPQVSSEPGEFVLLGLCLFLGVCAFLDLSPQTLPLLLITFTLFASS